MQVLDAIVADDKVLSNLGAAHALRNAVLKDKPPQVTSPPKPPPPQLPRASPSPLTPHAPPPAQELLLQLKQGPGKHIKSHAYAYRRKIDAELARLARIQTLQQRMVGVVGTLIISTSIGLANYISRAVYDQYH